MSSALWAKARCHPQPVARLGAFDSPYNTYRQKGLPPGPIANPGLACIRAVLQPRKTDFPYFVARGDGAHQLSRTYREQLAAQRLYSIGVGAIVQPRWALAKAGPGRPLATVVATAEPGPSLTGTSAEPMEYTVDGTTK